MHIQHVFRRGAIYWWRRRPPWVVNANSMPRIEVSLRTACPNAARRAAAALTVISEHLRDRVVNGMLTSDQARALLVHVAKKHSAKLDAISASELGSAEEAEIGRQGDLSMGWAFKLFAAQGREAMVRPEDVTAMREAELDDILIESVRQHLALCRTSGVYPPHRPRVEALLAEFGIPPSPVNYAQAEQLYLSTTLADLDWWSPDGSSAVVASWRL